MKLEMRTLKKYRSSSYDFGCGFWCCFSQARYCKRS